MTVTLTWFRLELRRRWRSLAVLALLVALATAAVLAAVAGARRGSTAIDRLVARTLPATAVVLPNQPGFDWDKVRALPEVEALSLFAVSQGFTVDGIPAADNVSGLPPADSGQLRTLERPVMLEGRVPDPDRVDEVAVTPKFAVTYHRGVGDRLTLRLMSTKQAAEGDERDGLFLGPSIPVTIVGVGRTPWTVELDEHKGAVLPSSALFARYKANILGPDGYINALIRLTGGRAGISAFRQDLARVSGRSDIDVWDMAERFYDSPRHTIGFESAWMLAFGIAMLAAAIALVGQSVARYTAATMADLHLLRAVGMTPRQATAAACAGPFLAAVAGTFLGVVGAAVASLWTPIGEAALWEPVPGFDVDRLVLGAGSVLVPALVLACAAGTAALSQAATRAEPSGHRSLVALAAARAGLPVPIVVGTRFALEPGRGRSAIPVRPALLGAVAGVLGVLAAFTFSAGVQDATHNRERFGQTYQLGVFFGINGQDRAPARDVLERLSREPIVQAADDAKMAVAESGSSSVSLFTYDPVGQPLTVVLLDGRTPQAADEIALTPSSANALGTGLGRRVSLVGGGAPQTMTVTGIGFVPESPHNDYSNGGWITPAGYDRLFSGAHYKYKFHIGLLALRPGTDVAAAQKTLTAAAQTVKGGEAVGFYEPDEPGPVRHIREIQELPVLLAAFLALLAIGAVGHALATAVRRRRHDVAVLRALGMTRRQARWTVVTQATVLAVIGLGFGAPLGVALGRSLWRVVADTTPFAYVAPIALGALLLTWPLTIALANLLAVAPGRVASRLRIGHVLRTE